MHPTLSLSLTRTHSHVNTHTHNTGAATAARVPGLTSSDKDNQLTQAQTQAARNTDAMLTQAAAAVCNTQAVCHNSDAMLTQAVGNSDDGGVPSLSGQAPTPIRCTQRPASQLTNSLLSPVLPLER